MKKVKIIFLILSLGGGGAERTYLNILNNINRNLFECKLFLVKGNNNSYLDFLKNDIEVIDLNINPKYSLFKLRKLIKEEKADIIFSTGYKLNILTIFSKTIRNSNSKIVLRETSYWEKGYNLKKIWYYLIKFAYNKSDKVVSLSQGIKKHLIDHFKIKENKIETIYNPVDINYILSNIESNKENHVKFRFINCARLVEAKNHKLLINAFYNANLPLEEWELFILGDGEEREELEKLVKKYKLENNIKFLGFQKNPFIYMKNSDLFVLSSKWEGFGNVIVESMAVGTPVLATDCPYGPREILENGKYGWLVKNKDVDELSEKIKYLFYNREEIKSMKKKVKERVEYFAVKNIVKRYEDLFLSLCINPKDSSIDLHHK